MKYCQNCGHKISNNTNFCPYCGVKQNSNGTQQPRTNVIDSNYQAQQNKDQYKKQAEQEINREKVMNKRNEFHDHSFGTITHNIMRGIKGIPAVIICTIILAAISVAIPFLIPFEIIGCICSIYNYTTNPIKNNNFQLIVYNIGNIYGKIAGGIVMILSYIIGFILDIIAFILSLI